MSRCGAFEAVSLRQLLYLPRLRNLDLSHNKQVTGVYVKILAVLPLTTLDLTSCEAIADHDLRELATSRTLTKLNVSDCDLITDAGMQSLTRSNLKHLCFSSCDRVRKSVV